MGFACDEVEWKTCLLSLKFALYTLAHCEKQKGEEKTYEAEHSWAFNGITERVKRTACFAGEMEKKHQVR